MQQLEPLQSDGFLKSSGPQYGDDPPQADQAGDGIAEEGEDGKTKEKRTFVGLHYDGRADNECGDDKAEGEAVDGFVEFLDKIVKTAVFKVNLELVVVYAVQ